MNETKPEQLLIIAGKAIEAMNLTEASPAEKAAALRTAAFVIEQAQQAQSMATVMANMLEQSRPKPS